MKEWRELQGYIRDDGVETPFLFTTASVLDDDLAIHSAYLLQVGTPPEAVNFYYDGNFQLIRLSQLCAAKHGGSACTDARNDWTRKGALSDLGLGLNIKARQGDLETFIAGQPAIVPSNLISKGSREILEVPDLQGASFKFTYEGGSPLPSVIESSGSRHGTAIEVLRTGAILPSVEATTYPVAIGSVPTPESAPEGTADPFGHGRTLQQAFDLLLSNNDRARDMHSTGCILSHGVSPGQSEDVLGNRVSYRTLIAGGVGPEYLQFDYEIFRDVLGNERIENVVEEAGTFRACPPSVVPAATTASEFLGIARGLGLSVDSEERLNFGFRSHTNSERGYVHFSMQWTPAYAEGQGTSSLSPCYLTWNASANRILELACAPADLGRLDAG